MAKPEWGHKRTCQSCGCRFYDLKHVPIICPKCGSTVEPDVPFKVRRAGGVPVETKAAIPAAVAAEIIETEADDLVESGDDEVVDSEDAAEEDEAGLIEDASDLGEDDDDMAEVMEHMDEGLEDEV
ncbi:TIGR02300 family protein [Magnetospirillum fulvum]|uniref:TIGR02300 family protein n=1 Tax=Magnetospirillum fulvum TaxID=1082 RepID=A0A1H6JS27_MAGFU|nr:TIGR02300 family protein [Magnetospirillum fulvum]SEH61989.1 TIGR02300 family protein [Magnetospirillum fulvum]